MDLFGDMAAILNYDSIVLSSYYGMLIRQIHTNLPLSHPIIPFWNKRLEFKTWPPYRRKDPLSPVIIIYHKLDHFAIHVENFTVKMSLKENKHQKAMVKVQHNTIKVPERAVERRHAAHVQLLSMRQ